MKLAEISKILDKIDLKKIERMYPSKKSAEKYQSTIDTVKFLLKKIEISEISPELLIQIETAANRLKELYSEINPETELGSKARLNEAVFLAESKYVERSIYLAGVAKEKKLKEPYRTQVNVLPVNACLFRYRQAYQLDEWIRENLEAEANGHVALILSQMKSSYLSQMGYFATEAYIHNQKHVYAAYNKLLATLIMAYSFEEKGKKDQASSFEKIAVDILNKIVEPSPESHFMELQYHVMNYQEFTGFKRLSKKYNKFESRLEFLSDKAKNIQKEYGGKRPKSSFPIIPYVVLGTRAASLTSVICLSAAAFGLDMDTISNSFDYIWQNLTGALSAPQGTEISFHTGGIADLMPEMHTGGVARDHLESAFTNMNLIDLMSGNNTGGLAG